MTLQATVFPWLLHYSWLRWSGNGLINAKTSQSRAKCYDYSFNKALYALTYQQAPPTPVKWVGDRHQRATGCNWDEMLSSGIKSYYLLWNVIICHETVSSGMKCYHLELISSFGKKCYHLELMLSSGTKSSGMKCYHLGCNVIIWRNCYHLGRNIIIWDEMLSSGANVSKWDEMLPSWTKCYHLGCNVIIWR